MPLQPPAGILWCSPGSAGLSCQLLGQSHGLAVRREFPNTEFSTLLIPPDLMEGNCARPVPPGLLLLSSLMELLPRGLAPNGRAELPLGRLLSWNRWPGLRSHLGQLSGWRRQRWPTHSLRPTCLLNLPLHLLQHLLHLPRGWGAFGRGGVVHRRGGLLFWCPRFTRPSNQLPPTPLISSRSGRTG